jgi:hypothetical protein
VAVVLLAAAAQVVDHSHYQKKESNKMNKGIGLIVLVVLVLYVILGAFSLASQQEGIKANTGEVWNQLDRCNQLLPRLEGQLAFGKGALDQWNTQITTARNSLLAAKAAGDLKSALAAAQSLQTQIQVFFENYPQYLDLTPVMTGLMDETAGCFNRITFARGQLIDSQKSYNVTRIFFFPLAVFFQRIEILGENTNPATTVVPNTLTTSAP